MLMQQTLWPCATEHLKQIQPTLPVVYFHADSLQATLAQFQRGFSGLVTYAVKANSNRRILQTLLEGGIQGFDVASDAEIKLIRGLSSDVAMHYNNPVRSMAEIAVAIDHDVRSYSVDSASEAEKLFAQVPKDKEIAVRFTLREAASMCDFGSKFGADPDQAVHLLQLVARAGYSPALTFHVGTQCHDPKAYGRYLAVAAQIAQAAGVRLSRINVGGGFPIMMNQQDHLPLEAFFAEIYAPEDIFITPNAADNLICEPGRAMVSSCIDTAICIKAIRDGQDIFLNDGIYGLMSEWKQFGNRDRLHVYHPQAGARTGKPREFQVFGPTCDSLDVLNTPLALPEDIQEGDYLLLHAMGAYTTATQTGFNGYGQAEWVNVQSDAENHCGCAR